MRTDRRPFLRHVAGGAVVAAARAGLLPEGVVGFVPTCPVGEPIPPDVPRDPEVRGFVRGDQYEIILAVGPATRSHQTCRAIPRYEGSCVSKIGKATYFWTSVAGAWGGNTTAPGADSPNAPRENRIIGSAVNKGRCWTWGLPADPRTRNLTGTALSAFSYRIGLCLNLFESNLLYLRLI